MSLTISLVSETKFATLHYLEEQETILLKFKTNYVPMDAFRSTMEEVEALAGQAPVRKMVFDKSNLTLFHQPSMEWYHVEWKSKMLLKGLRTYRKILPADSFFQQSVQIGRDKILKNNPGFDFAAFDIRYCQSVEEALEC